ncbi:hypothetical protein CE91St57_50130 [Lachnospiraceae bacterium]|nr:hypothetical protein CE91St57_50130 [Lachnospiraceae bacterium]
MGRVPTSWYCKKIFIRQPPVGYWIRDSGNGFWDVAMGSSVTDVDVGDVRIILFFYRKVQEKRMRKW